MKNIIKVNGKKKLKKNTPKEIWHYLYRELSKLHDVVNVYEKLFLNINERDGRYNNFFSLVLDQLSRSIVITLDIFFQKRANVWSLYQITKQKSRVQQLHMVAKKYTVLRNEWAGHLSHTRKHTQSFNFLSKKEIDEIRVIIDRISDLLTDIGREDGRDESYAMGWVGIEADADRFFYDLRHETHDK